VLPSLRIDCQSLPPSSTLPESRSPSKVPPATTPMRRVVMGVAPMTNSFVSSRMVNGGRARTVR